MSVVMGIDPSLNNTAYCILGGSEPVIGKIGVGKRRGVERLLHIEQEITKLLACHQPLLVVIEGYSYASAHQAHQAGELGGVLRRLFHVDRTSWIDVAPPTLKKFVTGKGNADKNLVMLNVYKRWGVETGSDDEADAYGLAKAGQYLLKGGCGGLTKAQQDALETIRGSYER